MKILWIPHAAWRIPQRAQLFCRLLAERHEVHVTDWAADFRTPRDFLSRRYLRNFAYRDAMDGNIFVHGIPRISPALFSATLRRLNTQIIFRAVQRIIDRYGIDTVVGTFVVPPPAAPRLIFDLFDDNDGIWRSQGRGKGYAEEIAAVERQYLERADAVVAASSVLVEKGQRLGAAGPVYQIPNGVDLAPFKQASDSKAFQPFTGAKIRRVGTVGNHDQPAELEKVMALARLFVGQNITFIIAGRGSAIPAAEKRARREGLTNIIFTGYIPPECIPQMMMSLDIGLCPYEKTPGDDARSPMRLLQYSAAGLPVVSTALEEVQRMNLPNVILVHEDAASIAEGICRALSLPKIQPPEIARYDIHRLAEQYEDIIKS